MDAFSTFITMVCRENVGSAHYSRMLYEVTWFAWLRSLFQVLTSIELEHEKGTSFYVVKVYSTGCFSNCSISAGTRI